MKTFQRNILAVACLSFFASSVFAGTCELKFTRTACPGKEAISYKKCDGAKSCSEFVDAASAKECGDLATKACEN